MGSFPCPDKFTLQEAEGGIYSGNVPGYLHFFDVFWAGGTNQVSFADYGYIADGCGNLF